MIDQDYLNKHFGGCSISFAEYALQQHQDHKNDDIEMDAESQAVIDETDSVSVDELICIIDEMVSDADDEQQYNDHPYASRGLNRSMFL